MASRSSAVRCPVCAASVVVAAASVTVHVFGTTFLAEFVCPTCGRSVSSSLAKPAAVALTEAGAAVVQGERPGEAVDPARLRRDRLSPGEVFELQQMSAAAFDAAVRELLDGPDGLAAGS